MTGFRNSVRTKELQLIILFAYYVLNNWLALESKDFLSKILKYFYESITKNYKLSGKLFFLPLAASRELSACIVYLSELLTSWHFGTWYNIYRKLYVTLVGHDLVNGNVNRKVS